MKSWLRDKECDRCSLGKSAGAGIPRSNLCIPTRPWQDGYPKSKQALVVVGKAPGRTEDEQGQCFVGPSGQRLNDWLQCIDGLADVYLTNTVRCRLLRADDDPLTAEQVQACRHYLIDDLDRIEGMGYERITLLLLGSHAVQALGLGSLKDAFRRQGQRVPVPFETTRLIYQKTNELRRFQTDKRELVISQPRIREEKVKRTRHRLPTFVTYHPAATMPSRSPHLVHSVADHFHLLHRHLSAKTDTKQSEDEDTFSTGAMAPNYQVKIAAVDIETYGILSKCQQRVFHPVKSVYFDKVPAADLVQSVSISWWHRGKLYTSVYFCKDRRHWMRLGDWADKFRQDRTAVVFFNALFDLTYLRAAGLNIQGWLVEDVAIWNYLHSDVRPEINLESLARLFGYLPAPEDGGTRSKKFKQYDSVADAAAYNAKDSIITAKVREHLRQNLKGSQASLPTHHWYSDLIHSFVHLTESGVPFDLLSLEVLKVRCHQKMEEAEKTAGAYAYGPFSGSGSQKAVRQMVNYGVTEAGLLTDPRLKATKGGEISTGRENVQLILATLPKSSTIRVPIQAYQAFQEAKKLLTSYVLPLAAPKEKDIKNALVGCMAYPQWYLVTQEYGSAGGSGGTKQGRPTCKNPALQTAPKALQECMTSRFKPGILWKVDMSQVELRVAALLSGDPQMIDEYNQGVDRHTLRAKEFFGDSIVHHPDFKTVWRQVGKQGNFLIIYRGGWKRLQETVRWRVGVELDDSTCKRIVAQASQRYPVFKLWQDELIRKVDKFGFVQEPVLGQRRWISQSPTLNRTDYESTIVNMPVQTVAANLQSDIQIGLVKLIEGKRLRSRVCLNTFDSLMFDSPLSEFEAVRRYYEQAARNSWYKHALFRAVGYRVPFLSEVEVMRKYI